MLQGGKVKSGVSYPPINRLFVLWLKPLPCQCGRPQVWLSRSKQLRGNWVCRQGSGTAHSDPVGRLCTGKCGCRKGTFPGVLGNVGAGTRGSRASGAGCLLKFVLKLAKLLPKFWGGSGNMFSGRCTRVWEGFSRGCCCLFRRQRGFVG